MKAPSKYCNNFILYDDALFYAEIRSTVHDPLNHCKLDHVPYTHL